MTNKNLKTTLKAWPIIAAATIGLCFLTKAVADLMGVELPDQQSVDIVRKSLLRAFESKQTFIYCATLIVQVLVVMPALEEVVFRWLMVCLPLRLAGRWGKSASGTATWSLAALSSALFSAAHYIAQPFPDAAFFALFFFGLAQCWLYRRTDRIWCPMLNHCLFNLTNIVLLFVLPE